MRRICEITVTLDFIFRLVFFSHEDVSFNIICLNVLEDIKQFYLSMWFKKNRLETPFKSDNVKALIKTSNCEKMVLYFSKKSLKIAAIAMLFWFSVTNNLLKMFLPPPHPPPPPPPHVQKYPRYPLVLKFNVTLARPLSLVIPYCFNGNSCQMIGACIFTTANET